MRQIRKLLFPIVLALFMMSGCGVTDMVKKVTSGSDDDQDTDTELVVDEDEDKNEDEAKDEPNDDKTEAEEDIETAGSSNDDEKSLLDTNSNQEDEGLKLQITKVDEDEGISIDDDPNYQMLNELVQENPTLGQDDDFSMFSIDSNINPENETSQILFLGINRLDEPIKNIKFKFTLGTTDGEYVWKEMPVVIDEEVFGSIKPDHAMPILLDITEEELEVYSTINQENQVFEMEEFTFDWD